MISIPQTPQDHPQTCCTGRQHALLYLSLAEDSRHDEDILRLLPRAQQVLFGHRLGLRP